MKKSELKNLIKKELKILKENRNLLLEYPTLTLGGATSWCADNCFGNGNGCTITPVTFIFSNGDTVEGYDSECSGKVTGTVIKAPAELERERGTGIVNKPDINPIMMKR